MGLEATYIDNSVDYSKDGIYELHGYKYKVAHDRLWLRLFHHDSTNNDYFPKSSMCYNLNENAYYIISNFQYKILPLKQYTYLLEYKSIPSFQIWQQDNYINDTAVLNYRYVIGDKWRNFNGFSLSLQQNCLDYTGKAQGYWYSIGTIQYNGYDPYFPGPLINDSQFAVKFADLWIMMQYMRFNSCKRIQPVMQTEYIFMLVILILD